MAILVAPASRHDQWKAALAPLLAGEELRWWPEVGDAREIDLVIAWELPDEVWPSLTSLAAILSLGAGTEQWQRPQVPEVPVVRLVDPSMSDEMAAYAVAWVVRHHRRFAECAPLQREQRWEVPRSVPTSEFRVGILGHGTIGSRIGRAFRGLGHGVNAWTRSGGDDAGVEHFAGLGGLDEFLAASDAVVNVLPSTNETQGLLTADRFARMRQGSIFVNIGRGDVLADEHALVAALDSGPLAAAVLDVTDPEPPLADSPLWHHPAVTLTAHLAGATRVATAARLIADNVARIRAGDAPFPLLDRTLGY